MKLVRTLAFAAAAPLSVFAANLQAKAMRANVQLSYNTAGCLISGFQVQPN